MITIALTEAKARLTSLARRAEAGEEVQLTRHGKVVARIVPAVRAALPPGQRMAALEAIMDEGRRRGFDKLGIDAARSQDFLYDAETGLPA